MKLAKGYEYYDTRSQKSFEFEKPVEKAYNGNKKAVSEPLKRGPPPMYDEQVLKKQVKMESDLDQEEIPHFPNQCQVSLKKLDIQIQIKILKKAKELGVECIFEGLSVILEGNNKELEDFKLFIKQLQEGENKRPENAPDSTQVIHKLLAPKSTIPIKGDKPKSPVFVKIEKVEKSKVERPKFPFTDRTEKNEKPKQEKLFTAASQESILEIETTKKPQPQQSQKSNRTKIVAGTQEQIEAFKTRLTQIGDNNEDSSEDERIRRRQNEEQKIKEEEQQFVEREIPVTEKMLLKIRNVEKRLRELGLFYEFETDKLRVLGPQKSITALTEYFYRIERIRDAAELEREKRVRRPKPSPVNNTNNTANSVISFSNEVEIKDIEPSIMNDLRRKGLELRVMAVYNENSLTVFGPVGKRTDQFLVYIEEMKKKYPPRQKKERLVKIEDQSEALKNLYPKYWNFNEQRPFCQVKLAKESQEFKEVAELFLDDLEEEPKIVSIERIQNKIFMGKYIETLQKKMEKGPFRRELLFQKSQDVDPKAMQCKQKEARPYKDGIYFTRNAWNVIQAEETKNIDGNYESYVIDVFLGRSISHLDRRGLKSDPKHDSVLDGEYYIIYNQFQSCPLYKIEYSFEGNIFMGE